MTRQTDAQLRRLLVRHARRILASSISKPVAREKTKDARYRWFVEHHGDVCAELDALSPAVLREVVADAIRARIDRQKWERAQAVEAVEAKSLRDFIATWPGAV